jgi:hypothetical protein
MPVFASLDAQNLEVAESIIELFREGMGRTQGEITGAVKELETRAAADHRFVRGLRTLLVRRCDFVVEAAVDPSLARRTVFRVASGKPVLSRVDREKVLDGAARELGISVEQLEKALWADSEEELVLQGFEEIRGEELLRLYNTSLAQTMLFKATTMTVQVREIHRELIRRVKRLGLMYTAERQNGNLLFHIDGPVSLLKMTEKYGTSLAKLFPAVIGYPPWSIRADIIIRSPWSGWGSKAPRILEFRIDDSMGHLFASTTQSLHPYKEFDSSVEEKFARSFTALRTGWSVIREPEALVAGGRIFIPDFLLKKNRAEVYLEIVGFWTQEYLERKLRKLRELEKVNLILAVDRNLACSGFRELKEFPLIYYKKEVPLKEVMRILARIEEREVDKELQSLSGEELVLEGDVIDLNAMAAERGISYEALSRALEDREGYVRAGRELVSLTKLRQLKRRLQAFPGEAMYEDVAAVVESEGIKSVAAVLEHLGYEVRWQSLNADSLKVIRKDRGR